MDIFETVRTLTQTPGPSGFERSVSKAAAELLRPLTDEVEIDPMGSVIGVRRCGLPNAKRILLDAHLDEVGMIVTGYDGAFLRFDQLGGIDPRVLVNREVLVLTQPPISGIIAAKQPEDPDKAAPMSDLRIDTGLPEGDVNRLIPIGTPVSYVQPQFSMGVGILAGKSMDDRACFALLLRALELMDPKKLDADVYVLGSVGEETDSRGAITAVHRIAPDYAVAVDVTFGKSPDCSGDDCFPLGENAIVGVGPNIANWMFRRMKEKAAQRQIPIQVEVMAGSSGTNGWDIQIQRSGIATAILSIPLRYMHTPVEVIHEKDLELSARLLAAFVEHIGKEGQ